MKIRKPSKDELCRGLERLGKRLNNGHGILEALSGVWFLEPHNSEITTGNGFVGVLRSAGITLHYHEWALIRVGEEAGILGETLLKIVKGWRQKKEFRRELAASIVYPALVLIASSIVMLFLYWGIIPEIEELYDGLSRDEKPPAAMYLKGAFLFMSLGFPLVLMILALVVATLRHFGMKHLQLAKFLRRLVRGTPFLGEYLLDLDVIRLADQLSGLMNANMPLHHIFRYMAEHSTAVLEKEIFLNIVDRILSGERLSHALYNTGTISLEMCEILEIGEESAQTVEKFEEISREAQMRCRWRAKNGLKLLEPVSISYLSLLVFLIVASFLMPLIQIYENVM